MSIRTGAHNAAYIGPNSSIPIACGAPSSELIAVISQSNIGPQTSLLALYDGPDVATVQAAINANASQTKYPLIQQIGLNTGQFLPFTFGERGILMRWGIVAIPAGGANSDGGWTILYD